MSQLIIEEATTARTRLNFDLLEEYFRKKEELTSQLADTLGFSVEERESVGLNKNHLFHALRSGGDSLREMLSPTDVNRVQSRTGQVDLVEKKPLSDQFMEFLEHEVEEGEE